MATRGKRRALGQHFLRDQSITRAIATAVAAEARRHHCQALMEIGPGKGAITLPLQGELENIPMLRRFFLVEKDPALAREWARSGTPVEERDFLDLEDSIWLQTLPLAVASNLPYSAGTAILLKLARHPKEIPVMVLMFQAEVAKRLRAVPSTKEWGSLSVWIQNRWDVEKLLFVPPGAFSPPPEVDSEVVILRGRQEPRIPVEPGSPQEELWNQLLRAAFAHRRKMLRSGLPSSGGWRNALEQSGVDGTKRAEALTWEEWSRLYAAVLKYSGPSKSSWPSKNSRKETKKQ